MIITPAIRKIYSDLQKQLFYLVPEKWESIYLYASVTEQILNLETGELFFYYFPKGILRKNPVNVYEIPNRFQLDEEEYIQLVEKLYITIKELRQIYKAAGERVWSSINIRIVGLKFEVEYNYDTLEFSKYSSIQRHIIWKYKNLEIPLESFVKKDRKLIQEYLEENQLKEQDIEVYSESIYKRPIKNMVDYNRQNTNQTNMYEEKSSDKKNEEQRYTYIKKEKQSFRKKSKEKSKEAKEPTYIEQVETQRKAVKSQILNHL